MSYNYLPIPPRVWSRVQKPCTYTDACGNYDIDYNKVYIPLTNQTVTQAQANYEDKMIYKGNILQYKGNSSRLTKSQKYSQLARMAGPNRTKVFATQGQTYTNPNTTGLQRVNYSTIPFPNGVVGAPNNISGPYQYNVTNPNGCNGVSIQDGGTLKCGYYTNPCTGEIIRSGATSATIYNPASASDVPGSSILFWNNKVETWFPKSQYFMNNSTDKWPVNYKGFVSAAGPEAPVLSGSGDCGSVSLSWTYNDSSCIPISGFNIYQNNVFIKTVSVPATTTTIDGLGYNAIYTYYINSISYSIESKPSNLVSVITYPLPPPTDLAGIITYYTGDVSILLYWNAPIELCFGSVSGYYIYVNNLQSTPYIITPSGTTTKTITDLSYNTSYTFYIRSYAISGGTIYYSTTSSFDITTLPVPPPTNLDGTITYDIDDVSIELNWDIPTGDAYSGVSGYYIYLNNLQSTPVITPSSTTTTTITDLSYNTSYTFYIRSYAISGGTIYYSTTSSFDITTLPVPPPTNLDGTITYDIDDVSIELNWDIPTGDAYSGVSGYYIYLNNLQSTPYVIITPSSTDTTTITDLSYNTSYTFYIRSYAVSGGTNYYSTDSSLNITTSVLEPPEALSATPGCAYVDLTWSDPTTTPSSYNIYYYSGAFIANVSSTSYTVSDLSYNTAYQFSVSSYNLGVSSELVSTSQVTTSQLNTPILAVSSYNASTPSISLSLSYDSSGCTSNPYSYKLYGGDTSPIDIPSNGQPTPYTLILSYSTTYTLYITYIADNNQESSQSNSITVNTDINSPTNFQATGTSPTTGTLTWTSPSQYVTSYTITGSINVNTTSTSYSLSNLYGNTDYSYNIVANYGSGVSSSVSTTLTTYQYIVNTNPSGYTANTNVLSTSGPGNYYYMFTATNDSGNSYSNPSNNVDFGILYNFTVNYDFNPNYLLVGGGGYGYYACGGGGGGIITGKTADPFTTSTTYTASVGGYGDENEANGGASSIGIGTNGTGTSGYDFRVTGGGGGSGGGTSGGGTGTIVNGSGNTNQNGGYGGFGSNGNGTNSSYDPFNDSNLSITINENTTSDIYCGGGGGSGVYLGYGYAGHGYGGEGEGADLQAATARIGYTNYLNYTGLFFGGGGGGGTVLSGYGNGSTGVVILYWSQ